MKTTEEKVEMLIKANQRLVNELKAAEQKIEMLVKAYKNLSEQVKDLSIDREDKPMICGSGYIREIDMIIECKETDWRGSKWKSYQLSLKGYNEVYLAFVPADIILEPDQIIQFSYDGGGRLKSLKIKNW